MCGFLKALKGIFKCFLFLFAVSVLKVMLPFGPIFFLICAVCVFVVSFLESCVQEGVPYTV